ncbi:acyltransferase [Staphylococcus warneri]|uniref:acyltransferase n=1 Tax=Staphylococcus warneri TaxID=1292 RepID=UPI00066B2050|nr:acyltransferase [Staphylococcus warneri]MBY6180554.1 acyltransferase [Staphylococcaceae bacterium DP2N0-1]RQM99648.1 acetyltransferase [Staphylococcus warneri]
MRKLKPHRGYQATNMNPLWHIYRLVKFPKVLRQTIIIEICRYMPNLKLKSHMYCQLLGMDIGNHSVFAFKVVPDLFYPELITVGNNSVIGYNTTILTHEILVDEFKIGKVTIGSHTLIGANVTILPGVTIGDHVKIGAGTVVSKDVPNNSVAFGNPIQIQ